MSSSSSTPDPATSSTTPSASSASSAKDAVRVVIRLRGGLTKTQEINKDNKSAQTVCVTPQVPIVSSNKNNEKEKEEEGNESTRSNNTLFKEVIIDKSSSSSSSSKDRFTFDTVFSSETTQETIFKNVAEPVTQYSLNGYNCCIFVYGQTGSGKSFSMFGPDAGVASSTTTAIITETSGITPRVLVQLFEKLEQFPESEVSWSIETSIFELYNENLYDLLYYPLIGNQNDNSNNSINQASTPEVPSSPAVGAPAPTLRIREDKVKGVYIEGMTKRQIQSPLQALRCIEEASKRKHVAETAMNRTSSRSHTIVQLFVTQTNHVQGGTKLSSQFFLVDLAGSERVSRSGATGGLLKEAQSINLSLTLLGNVINKLTDGSSKHIPYRDSKLTRLLSNSLGGNATTTLLCTTSVLAIDAQESISTLNFATRAKSIKNAPRANQELTGDALQEAYARALGEISSLKDKIRLLEAEVQILSLNHTTGKQQNGGKNSLSKTPIAKPPSAGVGIQGLRRNSSTTGSSSSNNLIKQRRSSSVSGAAAQQQQLQSPDQVSSFFENIVLEDLQGTVASLITDLNTEKEERQILTIERDDAIKRAEFHLNREKELERKVEGLEKLLREESARVQNLEKESDELKEQQRKDPNYERELLQKRLQEGLRALRKGTPENHASLTDPSSENNNNNNNSTHHHQSSSLASLAAEEKFKAEISELRHKVAYLSQKLNDSEKSEDHFENLYNKKVDSLQEQHEAELDEIKKEYQRASEMTEHELCRLQNKLDVKNLELTKMKDELSESEDAKDGLRRQVEKAHSSISDVLGNEYQTAAVLHQENRANAQRIRELAEKNEKQEKTIQDLRQEINNLLRDIENAPISADVKAKLLVRESLQKQRSIFKKKLMECFSYDG